MKNKKWIKKECLGCKSYNPECAKGYAAFIRTDGRIWRKIKKIMIHHETKKAEKPDIF